MDMINEKPVKPDKLYNTKEDYANARKSCSALVRCVVSSYVFSVRIVGVGLQNSKRQNNATALIAFQNRRQDSDPHREKEDFKRIYL